MSRKKMIEYVNVLSGRPGTCSEKKWNVLINHPIGRGRFKQTGHHWAEVPDTDNMIVDHPEGVEEEE